MIPTIEVGSLWVGSKSEEVVRVISCCDYYVTFQTLSGAHIVMNREYFEEEFEPLFEAVEEWES